MTHNTALIERNRARRHHLIETLVRSICLLQRLPDPDPKQLHEVVSEAMHLLDDPGVGSGEALPEPVVAFVAAAVAELTNSPRNCF